MADLGILASRRQGTPNLTGLVGNLPEVSQVSSPISDNASADNLGKISSIPAGFGVYSTEFASTGQESVTVILP